MCFIVNNISVLELIFSQHFVWRAERYTQKRLNATWSSVICCVWILLEEKTHLTIRCLETALSFAGHWITVNFKLCKFFFQHLTDTMIYRWDIRAGPCTIFLPSIFPCQCWCAEECTTRFPCIFSRLVFKYKIFRRESGILTQI